MKPSVIVALIVCSVALAFGEEYPANAYEQYEYNPYQNSVYGNYGGNRRQGLAAIAGVAPAVAVAVGAVVVGGVVATQATDDRNAIKERLTAAEMSVKAAKSSASTQANSIKALQTSTADGVTKTTAAATAATAASTAAKAAKDLADTNCAAIKKIGDYKLTTKKGDVDKGKDAKDALTSIDADLKAIVALAKAIKC